MHHKNRLVAVCSGTVCLMTAFEGMLGVVFLATFSGFIWSATLVKMCSHYTGNKVA